MIIVSVIGPGAREAIGQIRSVRGLADMLEFRLDLITETDTRELFAEARNIPVIATCRPVWEGGRFSGSERARAGRLAEAIRLGATYIDVESEVSKPNAFVFNDLRPVPKVISSHHLLPGVEVHVHREFQRLCLGNPWAIKFAYHAEDSHQCRFAFEFLELARAAGVRAIAIGMGPCGEATRILYKKFGGWATFASSGEGNESAPGQISAADLKRVFRADCLDRRTRVFGLVGNPVAQSKGVYLHNAQFARSGVNAVYCRFQTSDLPKFVKRVVPFLSGMSVTLPHKERMVRYLDHQDGRVRATGAVNTVLRTRGRLVGLNTDAPAALDTLERVVRVARRVMLVIGTGGAARAVVAEALSRGARVLVTGRSDLRARRLAGQLGAGWIPWDRVQRACAPIADVVVHATPVGMVPESHRSVVPRPILRGIVAVDAVYNPPVTRFLKEARARGSKIVSGEEWFIAQAVLQSRAFGVTAPDRAMMRRIFRRQTRKT